MLHAVVKYRSAVRCKIFSTQVKGTYVRKFTTKPEGRPSSDEQIAADVLKNLAKEEIQVDPFGQLRDEAPQLYDILNMKDTRLLDSQKSTFSSILKKDHVAFDRFLGNLYNIGKKDEILHYFERLGPHHDMKGEAPQIYLKVLFEDNEKNSEKILRLFNQPLGVRSNPMHIIQSRTRFQALTSAVGLILSIIIIFLLFQNYRGGGGLGNILNTTYSPVEKNKAPITFSDVKGNQEAKEELEDIVSYLKNPSKYANVKIPKGVLMVGPPGTGKTLMAKALAGEAGVPFMITSGSEFEEVFVGLGARRVRKLFEEARKQAPCIIFIDEIDAIGGSRDKVLNRGQQSLNQLLVELDGFTGRDGVIIIGATNLPQELDPALVRPGRFDRKVYLNLPEPIERKEIIDYYLTKHKIAPDLDVGVLVKQTAGFSGADLENLVNSAALEAIKDDHEYIDMELLEKSLFNIALGREKKAVFMTEKDKKLAAYHESGHALVALKAQGAPEIRKATLVPRGEALGLVNYLPSDEKTITKVELKGRLQMAMGGRAAEQFIFGKENITTGAASDLKMATSLATDMVTKYGMSTTVGPVFLSEPSGKTAQEVSNEVKSLCEQAYTDAIGILSDNEKELHLLANGLLTYETLDKDEIIKIINQEPLTEKEFKLKQAQLKKEEKIKKETEEINSKRIAAEEELKHAIDKLKKLNTVHEEQNKKSDS
eukprot:TRINITY_DN1257_c0_g1_i7.p1 TRINITY_DN1257_c0_g1~~TRINITY_DN1257_c0_g1_i7.p1  ORF type:complete len:710 (+),score=156.59 TRINITY_DN1257_c0_g1_i7:12-2141(+)